MGSRLPRIGIGFTKVSNGPNPGGPLRALTGVFGLWPGVCLKGEILRWFA